MKNNVAALWVCLCVAAVVPAQDIRAAPGVQPVPADLLGVAKLKARVRVAVFEDPVSEKEKLYRRPGREGMELFEFHGKGYDISRRLAAALDATGLFQVRYPARPQSQERYLALFEEFRERQPAAAWGQFEIQGRLREYKPIKINPRNTLRIAPIALRDSSPVARVVLEMKIIDTVWGQTLEAKKFVRQVKAEELGISGLKRGLTLTVAGEITTKSLEKATAHVIENGVKWCVDTMRAVPWRSRVQGVEGRRVFFEGDAAGGLKKGDILEIYRPVSAMGLREGMRPMFKLGTVKVEGFREDQVVASVLDGAGFAAGDFVELTSPHRS